jgi:hypothetical protein
LVGHEITVRTLSYSTVLPVTVIDPGVDIIDASGALGGFGGRYDMDFGPSSIEVTFTSSDYWGGGTSAWWTFGSMNPECNDGQPASIASVTPSTNIPPDREYSDWTGATWGSWLATDDYFSFSNDPAVCEANTTWGVTSAAPCVFLETDGQVLGYDIGDTIRLDIEFSCPAPAGPTLEFSGACPGPIDVTMDGITPGGDVQVVLGNSLGSTPVPVGPCAGLATLDLAGASPAVVLTDSDSDGMITAQPNISANLCGSPIQILDLNSCETSNVAYP